MSSSIFKVLPILVLVTKLSRCESCNISCEGSPIDYDHSISLFCQEQENQTKIDCEKSKFFQGLEEALTNVIFTGGNDSENQEMGNLKMNTKSIRIDPKNVSDLSIWASFDEIPDDAFAEFANLRELNLAQFYDENSSSVFVEDQAFRGLDKLESLALHVNLSDQSIPNSILQIASLNSLALYELDLKSVFRAGDTWPNLQAITIYDSPNMSLADDAFQSIAQSLNEIDLSNIEMEEFPNSISNLENLTRVDIEATALKEIPADSFRKSASSIRVIRLSRNRISILHPNSFRGLTALTVLQLAHNEIDAIPESIFDDLTSLEVLNLAANKISALPAASFQKNANLLILDLDENPMNISGTEYVKGHGNGSGFETTTQGNKGTDKVSVRDWSITELSTQTVKNIDSTTAKSQNIDSTTTSQNSGWTTTKSQNNPMESTTPSGNSDNTTSDYEYNEDSSDDSQETETTVKGDNGNSTAAPLDSTTHKILPSQNQSEIDTTKSSPIREGNAGGKAEIASILLIFTLIDILLF